MGAAPGAKNFSKELKLPVGRLRLHTIYKTLRPRKSPHFVPCQRKKYMEFIFLSFSVWFLLCANTKARKTAGSDHILYAYPNASCGYFGNLSVSHRNNPELVLGDCRRSDENCPPMKDGSNRMATGDPSCPFRSEAIGSNDPMLALCKGEREEFG
jgi:hypothetical protein